MMKSLFRQKRASVAAAGVLLAGAALTQGCLQREVKKQNPNTSNVFVEQIANTAINEIDLLFVIDNSVSMADKQEILVNAVPEMVQRLVNPLCVDANGNTSTNPGECPTGSAPEFSPVDDIHIGVITSSLGGHGSRLCQRGEAGWNNDDQAHLIASVRGGVVDNPMGSGFLTWDGGVSTDVGTLVSNFSDHVAAAGENGCGFEAPLEAWYRFLVDPQPPLEIVVDSNTSRATMATDAEGNPLVDGTVLAQREAFLRPEGLVAIVVLTDENDCSAMDGGSYYNNAGFGYLVSEASFQMPIATSMCETNPNDSCCFSCLQAGSPPDGCSAAECDAGTKLTPDQDRANVRCFQNKRRFGVDLLYPTDRYVDALTKPTIVDARDGREKDNPLLRGAGAANAGKVRDPGLVFFAGIVGLPWQDVATDEALSNPAVMEYRTATELSIKDVDVNGTPVSRWEIILGNPGLAQSDKRCEGSGDARCGQAPVAALDPFMIESIGPRTAGLANPISGDQIVDVNSTSPTANAINGHEANHQVVSARHADGGPANDDLQYACIFPLETPKEGCTEDDLSCDCGDEPLRGRPLCQPPAGGAAGTTQYYGKAYPGTRILEVLRDFGANSIVGSICPKIAISADTTDPNYGYNPAVQAIVDRLAEKLAGKCLPRELTIDEEGKVPCEVVEAAPAITEGGADLQGCNTNGRTQVPELIEPAVIKQLEAAGRCGGSSGISCSGYQMCSIGELTSGDGRQDCLFNEGDAASFANAGFCYIDPAVTDINGDPIAGGIPDGNGGFTNPIVSNCPASERRLLRFVGENTPTANSITFVACTADAASADDPIPTPPDAVAADGTGGTSTGLGGSTN